ncbi:MAG: DNA-binding protein [Campylobacteraceae bacterium]|nr:DNA-binding protein [Campylobacteraceae bacterium]
MKLQFKKIPTSGVDFDVKINDLRFYGVVEKISENLVKCKGVIEGSFDHNCDRCGEEFQKNVKEHNDIFISKGIYHDDGKLLNLIEIFDDYINFDTILNSELESYRCDYLYCENCK